MSNGGVRGQTTCVAAASAEDLILTGSVPINNDLMPAILQWRSDWLPLRAQSKLLNVDGARFDYARGSGSLGLGGSVLALISFEKASFTKPICVGVLFLDARQNTVTSNSKCFDPTVFFVSHDVRGGMVPIVQPRFLISCRGTGHPPRLSDAEVRRITQFRIRISPK